MKIELGRHKPVTPLTGSMDYKALRASFPLPSQVNPVDLYSQLIIRHLVMAQLGERLSAEREGLGLNPALTKNQGLLISQDHAGCLRRETLSRVTGG